MPMPLPEVNAADLLRRAADSDDDDDGGGGGPLEAQLEAAELAASQLLEFGCLIVRGAVRPGECAAALQDVCSRLNYAMAAAGGGSLCKQFLRTLLNGGRCRERRLHRSSTAFKTLAFV